MRTLIFTGFKIFYDMVLHELTKELERRQREDYSAKKKLLILTKEKHPAMA